MAGRKVFTSGEILTSADVNSFLMDQSVMVFADSSARSSAIPSPSEGMVTYREDANRVEVFDGSTFGPIGGILQVVSTLKDDSFSFTGTSGFVDVTGLSASITPSSASSKVLCLVTLADSSTDSATNQTYRVERGGTAVGVGGGSASFATSQDRVLRSHGAFTFLDEPNSTSTLEYQVQAAISNTSRVLTLNSVGQGVSSITLMEVAV